MSNEKKQKFGDRAKSWARKQGLHGPPAFFRFVVFTYVDCLSKESDDFVLKGGNLFWLYTRTPRHTVDLDLVTRKLNETAELKTILERACRHGEGITFELKSIKEIAREEMVGAAVTLKYSTEDGAVNKFDLDIVYALPTRTTALPSPIPGQSELRGATIENIIADKISACHRFGSGNTRMKDYDDLWRLATENRKVDWGIVESLLGARELPVSVDPGWVNDEMIAAWKLHIRRYKDLPTEPSKVLTEINQWLSKRKEK